MSRSAASSMSDVALVHPCFSERAHSEVGRIHLPVARRCNIGCLFCERKVCAHITTQHPGWARTLLSPVDAVAYVARLVGASAGGSQPALDGKWGPHPPVIGVAGPGEPLANPETFEALALVHRAFPTLIKCVSTNGLLLEERLSQLLDVGIRALTVTVNAADAEVGERIYGWIRYHGRTYRGREAARILIDRQMRGIHAALNASLTLKVNTVLIPGVNDAHMLDLATCLAELGVRLMNTMPLIPGGKMAARRAPTCDELQQARADCEALVPQFRRCEQCRADVIRYPGVALPT